VLITRPRRLAALAAATALVLSAGACSSSDAPSTTAGTSSSTQAPGSTVAPVPVDYSQPGPYKAGTTRVTIGDREMVVFYPSDDAGIAGADHVTSYNSGAAFSEELRATVASLVPEFVQDIPIDAYADAKPAVDGGPFPVVLHSHGFGGFYLFGSQHYQQLASWGFVVAAPDHKSRNLSASASGQLGQGPTDTDDLAAALAELKALNVADSPLKGSMNFDDLAVEGHSAGGSAAFRFAMANTNVKTVIGYAPAPPVRLDGVDNNTPAEERAAKTDEALAATPPPGVPSMIVAADKDGAIALPTVQKIFDWLGSPKRLVVVNNAGHNAFTDVCKPIRDQGGLAKYEATLPAFGPLLRLGGDGCLESFTDPDLSSALISHSAIAHYRYVFGLDKTESSLDESFMAKTFPVAFGSEQIG
jgi:predicted dienelactone hydrolase